MSIDKIDCQISDYGYFFDTETNKCVDIWRYPDTSVEGDHTIDQNDKYKFDHFSNLHKI